MDSEIYDGFATMVSAFCANQSPALVCSFPNVPFDSDGADLWLVLRHFPLAAQNYGIGNEGPTLHSGFFQVTVCERTGKGLFDSLAVVDDLRAYFPKGTVIATVTNQGEISLQSAPFHAATMQKDDMSNCVVQFDYRGLVLG